MIPGVILAALVFRPKKKRAVPATQSFRALPSNQPEARDPDDDLSPMELAEAAANTALAVGMPPEEAEIDAFQTYLLNGGQDVTSFSESISVDNDKRNPTLERWQQMAPEAIEEELELETELDPESIVHLVDNFESGLAEGEWKPEKVSGFGTGSRYWMKRVLVGGGCAFVLGPTVLPVYMFGTAVNLYRRDKMFDAIVHDLIKEAQKTGSDLVILPANTPQDRAPTKELVSRLNKAGFGVKFTGPASKKYNLL